jgi:hypothetical protein
MTRSPLRTPTLLLLAVILIVVLIVAGIGFVFNQSSYQSERHDYFYTIEFSYNTTINNVTLLLPVPELNGTPFFTESILNGTAYDLSTAWNLSIIPLNGTPMLAIRAARMVPEYHGYPVAIEPGVSILPATRVPGHEYSEDTPVLVPVTVAVMEHSSSPINTRDPLGHEPLFFPAGTFTPESCETSANVGVLLSHPVPVYVSYSSDRPVSITLRVSVQGTNAIWRGGWESNTYSDSVAVEITDGMQGWIEGSGDLLTGEGVYY